MNNGKITWTTEQRRLGDLKPWDKNPRQLTRHDFEHIGESIKKFGLADPLVINADNSLIGGHQRQRVIGDDNAIVDVRVPSRLLTEREAEELNIRLNKNSGDWDFDILANEFEIPDLLDWGFTEFDLGMDSSINYEEIWEGMPEYDSEDLTSYKSIIVHFENQDDVDDFTELISQKLPEKARYIWHPKLKIMRQDLVAETDEP